MAFFFQAAIKVPLFSHVHEIQTAKVQNLLRENLRESSYSLGSAFAYDESQVWSSDTSDITWVTIGRLVEAKKLKVWKLNTYWR